jgi:hypothetical protein
MTELEILKARLDLVEKELTTLKLEVLHGLQSSPYFKPTPAVPPEWPYQVTC